MKRRIAFSNRYVLVSVLWLVGMIFGMAFAYSFKASIAPIKLGGIFVPTSFSAILLTSVLPLCFVILFCYFRFNLLIFAALFMNGLLYGFCGLYLSFYFVYFGWLVRLFSMFSQNCCSTLLVILCPLLLSGSRKKINQISLIFLSAAITICLFDYFVVMRFLADFIL